MRRNKIVRLNESQLRSIVRTLISESAGEDEAVTDLTVPQAAELKKYLDAGVDMIFDLEDFEREGMLDLVAELKQEVDSRNVKNLGWLSAGQWEFQRGSVGYTIKPEGSGPSQILLVNVRANTPAARRMLVGQAKLAMHELQNMANIRAKAKDILDGEAIAKNIRKYTETPGVSWGTATPASKYGSN